MAWAIMDIIVINGRRFVFLLPQTMNYVNVKILKVSKSWSETKRLETLFRKIQTGGKLLFSISPFAPPIFQQNTGEFELTKDVWNMLKLQPQPIPLPEGCTLKKSYSPNQDKHIECHSDWKNVCKHMQNDLNVGSCEEADFQSFKNMTEKLYLNKKCSIENVQYFGDHDLTTFGLPKCSLEQDDTIFITRPPHLAQVLKNQWLLITSA